MNFPFLRRKPEPMPMTLADEAFAVVGSFDAIRTNNIRALRKYRTKLDAEVRRGLDALKAVDAVLSREDIAKLTEKIDANIEQALEGVDLSDTSKTTRKKARETQPV